MEIPKILLATKSPRRHEIFQNAGIHYKVVNIEVKEEFDSNLTPSMVAEFLAKKKSLGYANSLDGKILVTADTVVDVDNEILNKPEDEIEARSMLLKLSGKTHKVHTGVCIRTENKTNVFHETTEVKFRNITIVEINSYIKNCQPFDKAGSYGIQDWMGLVGVTRIEGCYYNVMGFPMSRFYSEIKNVI